MLVALLNSNSSAVVSWTQVSSTLRTLVPAYLLQTTSSPGPGLRLMFKEEPERPSHLRLDTPATLFVQPPHTSVSYVRLEDIKCKVRIRQLLRVLGLGSLVQSCSGCCLVAESLGFSPVIILGLLRRCYPFLHKSLGVARLFLAWSSFTFDDETEHPTPDTEAFVCSLEP